MPGTGDTVGTLAERGFVRLARFDVGLKTGIYWDSKKLMELSVSALGSQCLVKGMKKYVIVNQAADGRETYERDLPGLMRYMEDHFPEAHLYLGFFRDVPARFTPGYEAATQTKNRLDTASTRLSDLQTEKGEKQRLLSLVKGLGGFGEARAVLSEQAKGLSGEESALHAELQRLQLKLADHHEVIRVYQELGRATLLAFGYSSPLYASSATDLGTTVDAVVADVMNTHHTSVRQKLEGGQLQLFIEEVRFPWLLYTAESVGMFAPGQLDRIAGQLAEPAVRDLLDATASMLQVSPAEDIEVHGYRVAAKRVAAHALREFLKRVDTVEPAGAPADLPTRGVLIGQLMQGERVTQTPVFLPLDRLTHVYCSGVSGSGKSFLGRVIAEGAIADRRNIVVLDPGNQWAALQLAEDRKPILDRYRQFGLDPSMARGFPATVLQPRTMTADLHTQLEQLDGRAVIFTLKGLPKDAACSLAADILERLFRIHSLSETDKLRTLVVIEEAHRFAKRRSDEEEAKGAVARVEDAIDLIAREGRKYGLNVLLVSQTIRDFTHSAATIRQNTNTKIFMRSSDRELEYAADYVNDARQLTALKTGEALIHNPQFGTVKVAVRPPFSKVIELSPAESEALLAGHDRESDSPRPSSDLEQELLRVIRQHIADAGEPINVTQAMDAIGVVSGRKKQELLATLEQRGLIRSERLKQRGGPRVLYPTGP